MVRVRKVADSHLLQLALELQVTPHVPLPPLLKPLFQDDSQRLVKGVVHVDRGGVVVQAFGAPVFPHHVHVEVPALHLGLAVGDGGLRGGGERDGGEAWRAGEAFLRPAVAGVDPPPVHVHLHPGEAGDGIYQQECSGVVNDGADRFDGLGGAGGGLGVDDPHELERSVAVDGGSHPIGGEDAAPGDFDAHDLRPRALGDVLHPGSEHTAHADEHLIARFD